MSGLNLTGALRGYEEGKQWRLENDQRNDLAAANQAGAAAVQAAHQASLDQQRQTWTSQGNDPGQFQPSSTTPDESSIIAGMNARGDEFAKRGRWQEFADNEAKAAPIRNTYRQRTISRALQDYDATGDAVALAQAAYPTYHDGVSIVGGGRDTTGGQGFANASAGVEAARQQWIDSGHAPESFVPPNYDDTTNGGRYTLHLSNGKALQTTGQQLRDMAASALANPEQTAQFEYDARKNAALTRAQIAKAVAEAKARGIEIRQTEGLKHENKVGEIGLTAQGNLAVAGERNKGLLGAANIHAGATTTAAETSAQARRDAADIAGKSRVTAAKTRAGATAPESKRMTQKELNDQAQKMFGPQVNGLMGGSRIGNMDTGAIGARAHSLRTQNPNLTDGDALLQAGGEFGFRLSKKPGLTVNSAASAPGGASGPTVSDWGAAPTPKQGLSVAGASGADDGTDDEE